MIQLPTQLTALRISHQMSSAICYVSLLRQQYMCTHVRTHPESSDSSVRPDSSLWRFLLQFLWSKTAWEEERNRGEQNEMPLYWVRNVRQNNINKNIKRKGKPKMGRSKRVEDSINTAVDGIRTLLRRAGRSTEKARNQKNSWF